MSKSINSRDFKIHVDDLKNAAHLLRALDHKLRQQMLKVIHREGKVTVSKIITELKLEQSVASQHLHILRQAKLVKTDRRGRFIYYSVNYSRLEMMSDAAVKLTAKK